MCQHDILWESSCGPIPTFDTIFMLVGGPYPKLHPEVLNIFNVWEGIGSNIAKHLFA